MFLIHGVLLCTSNRPICYHATYMSTMLSANMEKAQVHILGLSIFNLTWVKRSPGQAILGSLLGIHQLKPSYCWCHGAGAGGSSGFQEAPEDLNSLSSLQYSPAWLRHTQPLSLLCSANKLLTPVPSTFNLPIAQCGFSNAYPFCIRLLLIIF